MGYTLQGYAAASFVVLCMIACSADSGADTARVADQKTDDDSSDDGRAGASASDDDFGNTDESASGQAGSGSNPLAGAGGSDPNGPRTTDGGAPTRLDLDPTATFDWPETPPGGGHECQEGTYTGTFACTFADAMGSGIVVELEGPVSLTFAKSMNGEFLEITDGDFEATANLIIGARATIVGRLDCNTLMLDAMAVDGMWAIGDPTFPLIPGGGIEGSITGTLDPSTGTLMGQWTFGDPAFGECPGTWSVTYVP